MFVEELTIFRMFKPSSSHVADWKIGECIAVPLQLMEANNMADDISEVDGLLATAAPKPKRPRKRPAAAPASSTKQEKKAKPNSAKEIVVEVDCDSGFTVGNIDAAEKCRISQEEHLVHALRVEELKQKMVDLGVYGEYSKKRPPRPERLRYKVVGSDAKKIKTMQSSFNRKTSENYKNENYTWTVNEKNAMEKHLLKYNCN